MAPGFSAMWLEKLIVKKNEPLWRHVNRTPATPFKKALLGDMWIEPRQKIPINSIFLLNQKQFFLDDEWEK